MRPLWFAAAGVVMVVVDFRVYSVDVVPDVIGWALLAVVLHRLLDRRWTLVAVAGGVGALAEIALPYHYDLVESRVVDPSSGEAKVGAVEVQEFDPVTGLRLLGIAVATTLLAVIIVKLLRTLRGRAEARDAGANTRGLHLLGWATIVVWVVPHLLAMAIGAVGDGYDPVWNDRLWGLEFVGACTTVVFAAALISVAREPWALPAGRPLRVGNWSSRSADHR